MKATNIDRTKNQRAKRPLVIRGQQLKRTTTIRKKGCGCGWKSYGN